MSGKLTLICFTDARNFARHVWAFNERLNTRYCVRCGCVKKGVL